MRRVQFGSLILAVAACFGAPIAALAQSHSDARDIARAETAVSRNSYPGVTFPLREQLIEDILPVASRDPAEPTRVAVTLPDVGRVTLELTPVSVRAPGYTLKVQKDGGTFESVDPGPESTYTGRVLDHPGSKVAASILRLDLYAMIRLESGTTYWIQPLWDFVKMGQDESRPSPCPALHVVYRGSDTLCSGGCTQDADDSQLIRHPDGTQLITSQGEVTDMNGSGVSDVAFVSTDMDDDLPTPHGGCGTDEVPCIAELAIDVDFEYFQAYGATNFNVQDRISAVVNVVNHQFQRDVHLTHRLQAIVIRTAEPDPYTAAGATDLLNQVKAEWIANGGGIPRDMVQLFTGRDLTGSDTGAAFDAAVCDNDFHYSLVQSDFSPLFACVTDNTAHFLGHLWGATHCNCPNSTMNATLSCANTFGGAGSTTLADISNFLESANCLSSDVIAPPNDRCDHATVVTESGIYAESNFAASNDGAAVMCGTPGAGVRDIYWTFTPAASGPVTVSTCGTVFDTILSVHTGCPATPTNMVMCNDDCFFAPGAPCPFTIQSCFTFNAIGGTPYYARAAGFAAANVGQIIFNITLPAAPLCAGDLDCDNDRDVADISHFIQALIDPTGYTATHPGCDITRANLNADAAINGRDIAAFTALLVGGPCP